MKQIDVYMTIIAALDDLCFRDQDSYLSLSTSNRWSSPHYNLYVDAIGKVRQVIWAMQMTTAAMTQRGFWPILGWMEWNQVAAGRIRVDRNRVLMDNGTVDHAFAADSNTTTTDTATNSSTISSPLNLGVDLRFIATYRGVLMDTRDVFGTAIGLMVLGAERGPDSLCPELHSPDFDLWPTIDAQGESVLKMGSLVKVVPSLMGFMVSGDRFAEMDIQLLNDGVTVAQAKLKKAGGTPTASQ